ncbi:MAG TPA: aspartate kinase [Thermoanaerobaculia bacterium]|nr:aspartate kinase [Thermoanaerobaculia bacterium]
MIVIKFGGTSVGNADRVAEAIDIVVARRHLRPIVVVSALAGVTDALVAAADAARAQQPLVAESIIADVRRKHEDVGLRLIQQRQDFFDAFIAQLSTQIEEVNVILKGFAYLGEITPRGADRIMSIGEKFSSVLFAYTLMMRAPAQDVHSETVVITDDNFGNATPDMNATTAAAKEVLLPIVERGHIPVMGGFIGRTPAGATTTLGRNGSDYSAAIVAAAVDAQEVQIWTDVDGLLTCDPRLVPGAHVIDHISFDEAAELAQFGAKLHPRTLEPAMTANIPVRVLNTHNPASPGTVITRKPDASAGPRSIARKRNVTMVHVTSNKMLGAHGFLAKLFNVFQELGISVDLIATSEVSVSMTVDERHNMEELERKLHEIAETVETLDNQCIIAVVGQNLMADSRVGARILGALDGVSVKMISLGRSGLNLSIVVDDTEADGAVRAIHNALFETPVTV